MLGEKYIKGLYKTQQSPQTYFKGTERHTKAHKNGTIRAHSFRSLTTPVAKTGGNWQERQTSFILWAYEVSQRTNCALWSQEETACCWDRIKVDRGIWTHIFQPWYQSACQDWGRRLSVGKGNCWDYGRERENVKAKRKMGANSRQEDKWMREDSEVSSYV